MDVILLAEIGLACALAAVMGYFLGKFKGAGILGGITLAMNVLTLLLVLPTVRLASPECPVVAMLETAIWTYVLTGFLGYFLFDAMAIMLLEAGTMTAAIICIYSTVLFDDLSFTLPLGYELPGSWLGLLLAVILIGTIGAWLFNKAVLRSKGTRFFRVLWFGFCATCLIGYWAVGRLGLLFVTMPTLLIFSGFLYYASRYVLPLQDDQRAKQENHRRHAFRSLVHRGGNPSVVSRD